MTTYLIWTITNFYYFVIFFSLFLLQLFEHKSTLHTNSPHDLTSETAIDVTQNKKNHRRPRVRCRPAIDTRLFSISSLYFRRDAMDIEKRTDNQCEVVAWSSRGWRVDIGTWKVENPSRIVLRAALLLGRIEGWRTMEILKNAEENIAMGRYAGGSFPFFSLSFFHPQTSIISI